MNSFITSVLTISSPLIKGVGDIDHVIELMLKNSVVCNVVFQKSVVEKREENGSDNELVIENGFIITICELDSTLIKESVWLPLQKMYNLNCAYLRQISGSSSSNQFSGCIRVFLGESKCNYC